MNAFRLLGLGLAVAFASAGSAQLTVTGFSGLTASVSTTGSFSVSIPNPAWSLGGTVGSPTTNARIAAGADNLGAYEELDFDYLAGASSRYASIRVYQNRPEVLFSVTYLNGSANSAPFPAFGSYPNNLYHLSYNGQFASPSFTDLLPDSPWIFFDASANTFIVSPASDYMASATTLNSSGQIQAGIASGIASLPTGMTHRTILTFGHGVNSTIFEWGQALTELTGKRRPSNDADILLKSISYWTDNGATYYYNAGGPSYAGTLEAVKAEFNAKGIGLGSLQLDSWWYPKGPDDVWSSHGGIWTYTAATPLFQPDLATFQATLGVPLITHARWIDAASPYRSQYTISGNVATDPQYWENVATYLQASGVKVYEQDWLGADAQTSLNLTDPNAFLGNMAASMASRGITMQYCMATPKHFLQTTNYGNLTTIRTSQDGFGSARWTSFLYASQFAGALGIWPFSDVLMSADLNSLIVATLSAGPVGIGDALGGIVAANLLKSVRSDGVIVKPDAPLTPVDSIFLNDAQAIDTPMVASTFSGFGQMRTHYIFAYVRATAAQIAIKPADYGIAGAAYLYDYLAGVGYPIAANAALSLTLNSGVGYYVLSAVGRSGIAMLGDHDQFVTMGRKRISRFADEGRISVMVDYAPGETVRTLFGYSPVPVAAAALSGAIEAPQWSASTQIFTIKVHPSSEGTAHVQIVEAGGAPASPLIK
jgi:hypothetical protein